MDHRETDAEQTQWVLRLNPVLVAGVALVGLIGIIAVVGIWWLQRSPSASGPTPAQAAGVFPDHNDAGQPPHPHLAIPQISHDFGTLGHDQKVEYVFKLYNTGTAELVIQNLESSCECTTASIGTKTVPPGGMTELTVFFDPGAHQDPEGGGHVDVGDIFRRVTITSNDPQYPSQFVEIYASVLEE